MPVEIEACHRHKCVDSVEGASERLLDLTRNCFRPRSIYPETLLLAFAFAAQQFVFTCFPLPAPPANGTQKRFGEVKGGSFCLNCRGIGGKEALLSSNLIGTPICKQNLFNSHKREETMSIFCSLQDALEVMLSLSHSLTYS